MILRTRGFKKITIIGVGLMGGSLGLAIKKSRIAREVVGMSQKKSSLDNALQIQAIDTACTEVEEAVQNADMVILATPVETIIKMLSIINPYLKRGCVVTDIGSAKAEVVEAAERTLRYPGFFVGSHPMVGSEKKGVIHARDDLFENAMCIMTPTKKTSQVAKAKVKFLWSKIGANIKYLTPEEHDSIIAYISHLPHLVAFSIMETVPKEFLQYASTGFRDTTRIAASSPQMWNDIFLANSRNVLRSLDELVARLSDFRKAIIENDKKSLIAYCSSAKDKRELLS